MRLLSLDASAKTGSVCITEDKILLSECFTNSSLPNSTVLVPMIKSALAQASLSIGDIDAFCVTNGPGSFTGLRIGIAAVKGLAFADNLDCAQISTLECIAYNFIDDNCIICPAMDARCNQVYTALFRAEKGRIERLSEDMALSIDELKDILINIGENIILAGDGAELCYNQFNGLLKNIRLSGLARRYQRAYGAALAAITENNFIKGFEITPSYLRLSQAERELRKGNENDSNRV